MIDNSINTELFECEVCGFDLEANMNPKGREVLSEDSVGAPVGTPGHPGIDEGTE